MKGLFILFLFLSFQSFAGDTTKLYNPYANAEKDVAAALVKARAENKHVLLQIGGNWCVLCYQFNAFINLDTSIKKIISSNYIVYHLNYSKENQNLGYLKKLGNPQRFGFPVLVVLDADGNRLYTQNSTWLRKGNGYNMHKVKSFLQNWSAMAGKEKANKE